jgi:hypothetical protein
MNRLCCMQGATPPGSQDGWTRFPRKTNAAESRALSRQNAKLPVLGPGKNDAYSALLGATTTNSRNKNETDRRELEDRELERSRWAKSSGRPPRSAPPESNSNSRRTPACDPMCNMNGSVNLMRMTPNSTSQAGMQDHDSSRSTRVGQRIFPDSSSRAVTSLVAEKEKRGTHNNSKDTDLPRTIQRHASSSQVSGAGKQQSSTTTHTSNIRQTAGSHCTRTEKHKLEDPLVRELEVRLAYEHARRFAGTQFTASAASRARDWSSRGGTSHPVDVPPLDCKIVLCCVSLSVFVSVCDCGWCACACASACACACVFA